MTGSICTLRTNHPGIIVASHPARPLNPPWKFSAFAYRQHFTPLLPVLLPTSWKVDPGAKAGHPSGQVGQQNRRSA